MTLFTFIATNEFDSFAGSELLWSEAAGRLATDGCEMCGNAPLWRSEPDRMTRLRQQERVRFVVWPSAMSMARRAPAKAGLVRADAYFESYRMDYLRITRPD
jgi:hypothetical protein